MSVIEISNLVLSKTGTTVRQLLRKGSDGNKVIKQTLYGVKTPMRRTYGIGHIDAIDSSHGRFFSYFGNDERLLFSLTKTPDGGCLANTAGKTGLEGYIDKNSFSNTLKNILEAFKLSKGVGLK